MHTKLNARQGFTVAALALATWVQGLSSGCVAGGDGGGAVVYGDGPWIQSDVVVEGGGPGWYGRRDDRGADHGYVHPSAGGGHPAEAHAAPAAHASVGGGGHEPDRR
jgi:hypothetical protein